MSRVVLEGLSKRYGDVWAVRDFSLTIEEGELVVLLGPSGCGKTTILRMIAGLVEATAGRIRLGPRDITDAPPYRRNTGLVFQGYALFPHLSVAENVAFGLEMRKLAPAAIRDRVAGALRLVRLDGLEARLPRQLSGGQQQRVALARAMVIEPELLLLDEPLSNLDAKLREEVRVEIRQLQRKLGLTTLMVTHDQEEALTMADRLVVMATGVIQQVGSQRELYDRPANRFVAGFVGRTNFFAGRVVAPGRFETEGGLALHVAADGGPGVGRGVLALRPERVSIAAVPPAGSPNRASGAVEFVSYLGSIIEYYVRLGSGEVVRVHAPNIGAAGAPAFTLGDRVHVAWPAEAGLVLADDQREEERR
jgi:putative spermidine/putrescine transport system ATP-binding protein